MRVLNKRPERSFEPFDLVITLQTQDEVNALFTLGNMANYIKESLESYKECVNHLDNDTTYKPEEVRKVISHFYKALRAEKKGVPS